ncbi:MAG: heme NO-binding domain-containing protein [Proteobacteria bacterium]|nr:heme NO-binding domain-containing protein [Pseudomonadota bacterium]
MKGIIFNLFEDFVAENWGAETYEEIIDACELKTQEPFVAPGGYPDEDLIEIVSQAVERLDVPLPDALRAFGRYCFPRLVEAYPVFAEGQNDAKQFLLTVESVIHVEVRKLFPDANPPTFEYRDSEADELVIRYRSDRKFCHLMEGLLEGVADHFTTSITSNQTRCALEGAPDCEFHLRFGGG